MSLAGFSAIHHCWIRLAVSTILGVTAARTPAQIEDYVWGIQADKLIVTAEGTLYWKGSGPLFPSGQTLIKSIAADIPAPRYPNPLMMVLPPQWPERPVPGEIDAIDGTLGLSYISGAGVFTYLSRLWDEETWFTVPDPARITSEGRFSMNRRAVYFTDETGEFLDQARLWVKRNPLGDGVPPELVADRTTGPNATWFRDIEAVDENQVIALMGNGKLSRFERVWLGGGFDIYVWVEHPISTGAICMTPHRGVAGGDRLVWAYANAAGDAVTFYSAPFSDLSSPVTLGSEVIPNRNSIDSMTVSGDSLFYQISSGSGGPMRRRSAIHFEATSAELETPLAYTAEQLCSTDRFVFWLRNRNTIIRMPVGAAKVTRNLAITGMEVIQAIQNPANEVQLVADKPTHVRVFGRILASSAGETAINLAPAVELHGYRGGVELPDSPLISSWLFSPPPPVAAAETDRLVQTDGYWFRLPDSWTTSGNVVLIAELNPSRVYSETNFLDNFRTVTATFTQKVPIGLKIVPTYTSMGITRRETNHREIFDQAAMMLPTSSLRVEYTRGYFIQDILGPYVFAPGITTENDDKDLVIIALLCRKIQGAGGTLAEPGGFDHYMSLLPQGAISPGIWWGGYSNPGDTVSSTGAALIVVNSMSSPGELRYDRNRTRFAAVTLAHELGHNYGRMHVAGCLDPSFTNPEYPYAGGTISDLAGGHLGFNSYHRKLLPLWGTGDTLTYCDERWVSDYTWRTMFSRLSTGAGPAMAARPARKSALPGITSSPTAGYTAGIVNTSAHTSSLLPVCTMGAAEEARALATAPAPGGRYVLKAFQGAVLKANFPVGVVGADAGSGGMGPVCGQDSPDGREGWMALVDDLLDVDRLELHDLQTPGAPPLAVRTGGGSAPTVTVHKPLAGPVSGTDLRIEWSATDDGPGPLTHFVRISPDNGSTWRSLASEYTGTSLTVPVADLPGGPLCRIEVIASDGILCGRGVSAPFQIDNKPPEATILFENETRKINVPLATARFEYGERILLHAEAGDLEDGWLPTAGLRWSVRGPLSSGSPAETTGTGRRFGPRDLKPGLYNLALDAVDSAGATTRVDRTFTVRTPFVEEASSPIVIDGYIEESGYASDRWGKALRHPTGEVTRVALAHEGSALCIAVSGLRTTGSTNTCLSLCLDSDSFPASQPTSLSRRIRVRPNGATELSAGTGTAWIDWTNTPGLVTAVAGGPSGWNAEIRIPDELLPSGFNGGPARLFAGQMDIGTPGVNTVFPSGGAEGDPSTWLEFMMGADPQNPADADGDGMPDQWETDLAGPGGSGLAGDHDADGQTDYEEFVAGTDAGSPASRFVAEAFADFGNGVQLTWPGARDRTYSIWRSTDLADFELIAETVSGPPYPGPAFWTDPNPPSGLVYYKIEAHYFR